MDTPSPVVTGNITSNLPLDNNQVNYTNAQNAEVQSLGIDSL